MSMLMWMVSMKAINYYGKFTITAQLDSIITNKIATLIFNVTTSKA